jgi:peptidoglycan/xylan/chitin deacetylase (PgdA/CDA1 family)
MYHDVVPGNRHAMSGFPSPDAALYKITPGEFDDHLRTLYYALPTSPISVFNLSADVDQSAGAPWILTFDDGGVSAYTIVADRLEELGWRGHFLVTTDYIGTPPFLNRGQIRELHARGHIIGTHSCSHPLRMASCDWNRLLIEWNESVAMLSDILGEQVIVGSVPGGQFSTKVAQAAARAGLKILFTSEPTTKCWTVDGCLLLGRYTIQRWMSAQVAANLALGRLAPCLRQALLWNAKKITKKLGGEYYLKVRNSLIRRG